MSYDLSQPGVKEAWHAKFPADVFPVLAFTGAPAYFPVREEHVQLQKYLRWNDDVSGRADKFIRENLDRPFVGVHLRNGADWVGDQ